MCQVYNRVPSTFIHTLSRRVPNRARISSYLHRASTVSKHFFINPTDAHNYKITGMLKKLKFP